MSATVTQAQRAELVSKLKFTNESQQLDLSNPNVTQPELVLALLHLVHLGHNLLITSVKTDHGDDSALGVHGHSRGYSADLWPVDDSDLQQLIQDCCTNNQWVARLGLGGSSQSLSYTAGDTIVFDDNSTDHLHVQTGG
jgi:hypothetical protein